MKNSCRLKLTQGKYAIVDADLYGAITALGPWHYDRRMNMAILSSTGWRLNRVVCELAGCRADARVLHKNANLLDNRRSNLLTSLQERLWFNIKRGEPHECWPWTGRTTGGYGHISYRGKELLVHRLIFEYSTGKKPGQLAVMHTCDNPRCCNPRHLRLGTWADNNRDRARKGRSADNRGEKSPSAKLTEDEVRYILQSNKSGAELARELNVCPSLPSKIRHRKLWSHVR